MPQGARQLPEECLRLLAASDLILHAGDFVAAGVPEESAWVLNPGSPTERRRAPARTMMVLETGRSAFQPRLVELT